MEVVKIIFFALGTFYGIEDSRILSEKTTVAIDPKEQIIRISQEGLYSIIRNEQDSLGVLEELERIGSPYSDNYLGYNWREELETYVWKTLELISVPKEGRLDAKIELKYNTDKQLEDFGIGYSGDQQQFVLVNIDSWNIQSGDAELRGNHWYFKDKVSFTLAPSKVNSKKNGGVKESLFSFWEKVKP